ncbi:MAG: HAD family hydrolase [Methylococcaceae bacterium]|nr:HAD family hydrolase [Methylococcaceae bacterium]
MLQALIFDVDGTLADTERQGHRVAFNRAFAEAGLSWAWDEALYGELLAVTGGKERMRHFIAQHHPELPLSTADLDIFIADLQAKKTRHYTDLMASGGIPARPGVIRLLKEAMTSGLRLAIATTTTPQNVDALLAASFGKDALDWFEVIGAGDVVAKKKPAPDIYQWVLAEMGLSPRVCMAFEDSENGFLSSSAAGLPTLVTVNDYTAGHDFPGALLVIDHLGEPNQALTCLSPQPWPSFDRVDVEALLRLYAMWLKQS